VSLFWNLVADLLQVFFFLLIARLVLDYVQMFARSWRPTGVVLVLAEIIYSITDPPLKALRRVIPPLRIGGISLDLSFLVVIILVQILAQIASGLASN
jgi:YggT family protein